MSEPLVLCYHALSEHWPSPMAVTPKRFGEHVSFLVSNGYRGVTFWDAVTQRQDHKAVAITFDDAFSSVMNLARPILAEADMPATVFAPSAFIDSDKPMSWPEVEHWAGSEYAAEMTPMSWDDLWSLSTAGWEIGSHGRSHARLPELAPAELDAELRCSREAIEERLAQPCRSLAYPFGAFNERVVQAARRAGYGAAAGTLPGRLRLPTGPLDWSRIVINRGDGDRRFRVKTSRQVRWTKSTRAWDLVAAGRQRVRLARRRTGSGAR